MQIMMMIFVTPSKPVWRCVNESSPACPYPGTQVAAPPCDLPRDAWEF